MITASAPAKIVLLGEYSVLEGSPALVMAVDRRVRVRLERGDGAGVYLELKPLSPDVIEIGVTRHSLQIASEHQPAASLVAHILTQSLKTQWLTVEQLRGLRIRIDSSELFDGEDKLGLGSSAAVCVALVGALARHGNRDMPSLDQLLDLHYGYQGSGSGLDVACSFTGGLIEFCRRPMVKVRSLAWPPDLAFTFVWSGKSASTGDFLKRLANYASEHPDDYQTVMGRLGDCAEQAVQAMEVSGASVLKSAADFTDALFQFGQTVGLPVFSSEHRAIADLLESEQILYKPCGAGGGDLGVAVAGQHGALDEALEALKGSRFRRLSLGLDEQGLCVY